MSENKKTSIGVVGCGAIAELYHLPALKRHVESGVKLWLADTSEQRLRSMAQQFEATGQCVDYQDLAEQVDGVIIATPPASHFALSKYFLEQGVHVLCEKPLTEDVAQARQLVQAAKDNGVSLAVNQTRRLFPTYQKIRELIQAGELGQLRSVIYHDGVEFDWPAASPHHFAYGAKGAWSDTGVHLLDTVCYWLDAKPELVQSLNDSYGGPEALATVRMQHENCKIEIKVSRLGKLMNGFVIEGDKGTIEASAETFDVVAVRDTQGNVRRHRCGSNRLKYNDFAAPLIDNFIDVVEGTAQPTIPAESVVPTIDLLMEAYQRAEPYRMPWNDDASAELIDDASLSTLEASSPANIDVVGDAPKKRILVTGAAGFLGGRLVEWMKLADYGAPLGTIRSWSRAARIARHEVDVAVCDILDQEQIDAAMRGVEAVVHCAKTDDRESIVGGTKLLLESAEKHQVERFVFLSTAEVYGADVAGDVTEQQATPMTGRLYGDCKVEAEGVVQSFANRLPTTILRPSIIYGPFSTSWSTDMAKRLLSGKWGAFEDDGDGIANLVYVDDLIQAILRSIHHPHDSGLAFNVNGPDRLTWNEYFELFNDALGRSPLAKISKGRSRLRSAVIGAVDKAAGMVLDRFEDQLMEIYLRGGWASKVMKRIKGEINATPSGGELNDLFSRQAYYVDTLARQSLGYVPQVSIRQGLQWTTDWLRLHEVVPSIGHDTVGHEVPEVALAEQSEELVVP